MVGLGAACFGPLLGAAADRFGQRPVLLVAGLASTTALGLMAWVVYSPLPGAAVLAVAFLVGGSAPQIAPMSRSRLVQIIAARLSPERRERTFDATMAYESAADEMVFIVGPFLVGLLGTALDPWAPVAAAAVVTLVFVSAFAVHPTATALAASGGESVPPAPAAEPAPPGAGRRGRGHPRCGSVLRLHAHLADRLHGRPRQRRGRRPGLRRDGHRLGRLRARRRLPARRLLAARALAGLRRRPGGRHGGAAVRRLGRRDVRAAAGGRHRRGPDDGHPVQPRRAA
ncbi:MFS transporter [Nocardioides convexus]|uniref:MFS transporter n=1 Tax=Nocardioides convexus TaxID=2712224 RepID=UPI0024183B8C|nr:MFS transporter [Nocardioides convexus]